MKISTWTIAAALLAAVTISAPQMHGQMSGMDHGSAPKSADVTGLSGLLSFQADEFISVAEAMPADKYDFAPKQDIFKDSWKTDFANPKPARSFADQVKHVAQANYYFFTPPGMPEPKDGKAIGEMKTKAEIVAALKKSVEYAKMQVAMANASNAWDAISIGGQSTTRIGAIAFGIAHMNDHMGQMSVYLRMCGIIPPQSRK